MAVSMEFWVGGLLVLAIYSLLCLVRQRQPSIMIDPEKSIGNEDCTKEKSTPLSAPKTNPSPPSFNSGDNMGHIIHSSHSSNTVSLPSWSSGTLTPAFEDDRVAAETQLLHELEISRTSSHAASPSIDTDVASGALIWVNPKQHARILKRRTARQNLELSLRLSPRIAMHMDARARMRVPRRKGLDERTAVAAR